jgi:hypothetical protein
MLPTTEENHKPEFPNKKQAWQSLHRFLHSSSAPETDLLLDVTFITARTGHLTTKLWNIGRSAVRAATWLSSHEYRDQ